MKGFKFIFVFLFVFVVASTIVPQLGYAQDINKIPTKKLLKFGEDAESKGDYYTAITYYERYCELVKTPDYEILLKVAQLYRKARNYPLAEKYFKQVYEGNSAMYTFALYYWAEMLKMQGKYKEASDRFTDFKRVYKGKDLPVDNQIAGIKDAQKMMEKPLNLDLNHLNASINKPHIEFSPIIESNQTLIFGSMRTDSVPYIIEGSKIVSIPLREYYVAKRVKDLEWQYDDTLKYPFNSKDHLMGSGAFSPDGKKFVFTRCQVNWENKVKCDLWMSRKDKKGEWQNPEMLKYPVNTAETFSSVYPAIGLDSKKKKEVLYFASDRTLKSEGGWDLWYALWEDKDSTFTKVENIGRKINTKGNEVSPYYDEISKTLYFSSDFWPGMGGLDIFKIKGSDKNWKKTENVGYPINSSTDDLGFSLNPYQRAEGFFVSNRSGGQSMMDNPTCCDDIYTFYNKDFISISVIGNVRDLNVEAQNNNITNLSELKDASVVLYEIVEDEDTKQKALLELNLDSTDAKGNFYFDLEKDVDYRLMFKKDGYFYKQINLSTQNIKRSDTIKFQTVNLEEIQKKPVVFYIYYAFDSDVINDTSKNVIDTTLYAVLEETPDIIVEVSSHTDNQGDSLYNINLSQRRAENVVNYLVSKGIDKSRMVAKGYGENKPIASNETSEGRQKNRRSEFMVIGSKDPYSKLNVTKLKVITKKDIELKEKEKQLQQQQLQQKNKPVQQTVPGTKAPAPTQKPAATSTAKPSATTPVVQPTQKPASTTTASPSVVQPTQKPAATSTAKPTTTTPAVQPSQKPASTTTSQPAK